MNKEPTKIKCRICLSKNPPIISYLSKQLWGKNKEQHYLLTCENCGQDSKQYNQAMIELMESLEK